MNQFDILLSSIISYYTNIDHYFDHRRVPLRAFLSSLSSRAISNVLSGPLRLSGHTVDKTRVLNHVRFFCDRVHDIIFVSFANSLPCVGANRFALAGLRVTICSNYGSPSNAEAKCSASKWLFMV